MAPGSKQRTNNGKVSSFLRSVSGVADAAMHDPYAQHIGVFRAVNTIGQAVARAPIEIMQGDAVQTSGPWVDLLERPNRLMSQAGLSRVIAAHQLLWGNAYIYADEPDSRGVPRALIPLPPQAVRPERLEHDAYGLKGWRFQPKGGQAVLIPPNRIAHIRYAPHPSDPLMGVSPLDVARMAVDADHLAGLWNRAVLKNSGSLAGVLRWKGEGRFDEADARLVRDQWTETYGGSQRAESIAVLGANFDFQSIGVSPRDMQWLEARKWNLAEVARAFAVPLLFLNEYESSGLSDAGLKIQYKMLYTASVIPMAVEIAQALTATFLRPYSTEAWLQYNFDGVEALRDDMGEKLTHAKELLAIGYSLNAVNAKLGLGMDDVAWGDVSLVNASLIPAATLIDAFDVKAENTEAPAEDAPDGSHPELLPAVLDLLGKVGAGAISLAAAKVVLVTLLGLDEDAAGTLLAGQVVGGQTDPATAPLAEPAKATAGLVTQSYVLSASEYPSETRAREALAVLVSRSEIGAAELAQGDGAWRLRLREPDEFVAGSIRPQRAGVGILAMRGRLRSEYRDGSGAWRLPDHRRAVWANYQRGLKPLEAKFLSRFRRVMMDLRTACLRELEFGTASKSAALGRAGGLDKLYPGAVKKAVGAIDPKKAPEKLRPVIGDTILGGAKSSGIKAASYGVEVSPAALDLLVARRNKIVSEYYDQNLGRLVTIFERTRTEVASQLGESIRLGENLNAAMARVRESFNGTEGVGASRARTIARTETGIAASFGEQVMYAELGVTEIEWLSAGDEHVRPEHQIDGEVVAVGTAFSNGLLRPLDPSGEPENVINCRCDTIPVSGI